MPIVHLIDSIKILLYFDDHMPPHFHAQYNEYEVLIVIATLSVYSGSLPSKQLKKVMDWAGENKAFLEGKWEEYHS